MRVKGSPYKFNAELFADRVKKLRLKHDLKQHQIANAIKKTRAAYGGCENGNFLPGIAMLLGLKDFYEKKGEKLSMDYLFGFTDSINSDVAEEAKRLREQLNQRDEFILVQKELIQALKEKIKTI